MNNKIFILLALLLTTGLLPAQETHTLSDYIHLGRVNGLSSNTVMSIEDDDLGRIWIGTQKGLNIYDGYHLDRISELDGIKVNDLHHTPGGMLIASPAFLSFYCYETGRLSKILADGKYIEYAESFQQIDDEVYFLGDQSLYAIRNGEVRRLKEESKATRLAIDKYHAFWMADKSYIYRFDPKLQNSKQYTLGGMENSSYRIICIYADGRGDVWVGTVAGGLYRFNRATDQFEPVSIATLPSHRVIQNIGGLCSDQLDRLWIGNHNGVSIYDANNNFFQNYLFSNEYNINTNSTVTTVHRTRTNNMVVGTYTNGLYYIQNSQPWMQHFYLKAANDSFSGITGNAIFKDKKENIWLGTNCNGINVIDKSGRILRQINEENMDIDNDIVGMTTDEEGTVWASSLSKGLYRIEGKGGFAHFTSNARIAESLTGNTVYAIHALNKDSIFIAANGGIDILETANNRFTHLYKKPQRDVEYFNITAGGTKIYTISIDSIFCYDRTTKKLSTTGVIQDYKQSFLQACYVDRKDRLWVGTTQGEIYCMENNRLRKVDTIKLPRTDICGISGDNKGNLWIATVEGLYLLDNTGTMSKYTIPLCERNNQFNVRSSYTDNEGNIYFGTTNGILTIHPDKYLKADNQSPVLYLSKFKLFGKVIEASEEGILKRHIHYTERITLKNYQNFISFIVNPILYKSHDADEFTCLYNLEGLDANWYEVNRSSNEVSFTGLTTGTYHLNIKLINREGKTVAEKKLEIIVKPPFLLGSVMIPIYLILLCVLGYLAYRYFRDRLEARRMIFESKQEQAALKRLNNYKLDYFTLISQEFSTPLSVLSILQNEILPEDESRRDDVRIFKRSISRMEYLMNQLMEFRTIEQEGTIVHNVPTDIIDFTKNLIDAFVPLFSRKNIVIHLKTGAEVLIVPFDAGKLEIIMANLLSNIYRYSQEPGEGTIQIHPRNGDVELEIFIPGNTLTEDQKTTIFQPYFKTSDESRYLSNGLDRMIVSCLVKQLEITFNILPEESGNTFYIKIPNNHSLTDNAPSDGKDPALLTDNTLSVSTIVDNTLYEEDRKEAQALTLLSPPSQEDKKEALAANQTYKILLVEYDSDTRLVLAKRLKQYYSIVTAADMETALLILKSHFVDVVIAGLDARHDDCIELCRQIKCHKQMMHIPVVVIFDKNQKELKRKALEVRADAVYEKPLDISEFHLSLDTILYNKKILRNHYVEMSRVQAVEQVETNADETFISKLTDYIVHNFNKPSLSMTDLTEHLGVSRTQLYLHVRRITGMSPSGYILHIKMEEAKRLLLNTQKSSAEISYDLGYCNPNHFSKQFKEYYEVSPSQYRKNNS